MHGTRRKKSRRQARFAARCSVDVVLALHSNLRHPGHRHYPVRGQGQRDRLACREGAHQPTAVLLRLDKQVVFDLNRQLAIGHHRAQLPDQPEIHDDRPQLPRFAALDVEHVDLGRVRALNLHMCLRLGRVAREAERAVGPSNGTPLTGGHLLRERGGGRGGADEGGAEGAHGALDSGLLRTCLACWVCPTVKEYVP